MSHIVEIATQVKDEQAVRAACTRLQLSTPEHKTCRLFSATATGLAVQLPGWNYPVVCENTKSPSDDVSTILCSSTSQPR